MKERPILFSGEMARAILDGRKTQTRRVVKKHPLIDAAFDDDFIKLPENYVLNSCPYGQPGDRLWVKEAYWAWGKWVRNGYTKSGRQAWKFVQAGTSLRYMDGNKPTKRAKRDGECGWAYRHGWFMPKAHSRITLEITDVRVQRLQEISEEDAKAEGFDEETCEAVLLKAAGKSDPDEAYYVTDDSEDDVTEGYLCYDCAEAQQKEHGDGARINAATCPESDGPAYCDKCYRPLYLSLTTYGIESELLLGCTEPDDIKRLPVKGMDAAIAAMIAGGIGDLQDEHKGRLAQIGFATLWNSINAKKYPWDSNPWVWAITFKREQA